MEDSNRNLATLLRPLIVLESEAPLMDYVYAYDLEDGDITDRIEVLDNLVDMSTPGEYVVTFAVTWSYGSTA